MPTLIENVEKIKMPYRILIFVGSLVAIFAILVFAIYQPYQAKITVYETKIRALDKKLRRPSSGKGNLRDLKKRVLRQKII